MDISTFFISTLRSYFTKHFTKTALAIGINLLVEPK
jgi:hypothetical protein